MHATNVNARPGHAAVRVSVDREPGMLLTPVKAIRSHCLGCCGSSKEVALCTVTECPLWPLRFGSRSRARRIVSEERRRGDLSGTHWAEQLDDYTSQRYHQTDTAAKQRGRDG